MNDNEISPFSGDNSDTILMPLDRTTMLSIQITMTIQYMYLGLLRRLNALSVDERENDAIQYAQMNGLNRGNATMRHGGLRETRIKNIRAMSNGMHCYDECEKEEEKI